MRVIVGVRRQHDLGIGGQLDLPNLVSQIGNRDAANFRVVFRRNRHFQGRRDGAVAPDDFGAALGESDVVTGRRRRRWADSPPTKRRRCAYREGKHKSPTRRR